MWIFYSVFYGGVFTFASRGSNVNAHMDKDQKSVVALIHGKDRPGLVALVSNWIFEHGGNILHADLHRDLEAEIFFQRVEWETPVKNWDSELQAFEYRMHELGMHVKWHLVEDQPNVALFVSKIDHCFHDLILRWKSGEYPGKICCILSNHKNLEIEARKYQIPYYYVPVSQNTKEQAEAVQLEIIHKYHLDLIILARYMQVLSPKLIENANCPIINIHHSFLPAFVGAKPYHQAFERGVKIIGATAHYVTEKLDAGPIIQQDVARIHHRHMVRDIIRKGKDLEKMVLSQAVRWHLEHRVLSYHGKTVVFD